MPARALDPVRADSKSRKLSRSSEFQNVRLCYFGVWNALSASISYLAVDDPLHLSDVLRLYGEGLNDALTRIEYGQERIV